MAKRALKSYALWSVEMNLANSASTDHKKRIDTYQS